MILITGGTGTSGVPILQQLSAKGASYKALSRDPAKVSSLRLTGAEPVKGDLDDVPSLEAALQGVDRVLLNSSPNPREVELQGNLITAAQAAGVKHIVKVSAMGANRASPARFLRWHGETEAHVRSSGLAYTFLRPTFFFQNLLGFASMAKQGHIYQAAADGRSGLVDVRDIAAVAVKTLTEPGHEGNVYELTGPQAISYHDVAAALTELLRKEVQYINVPPEAAKQGMMESGMPEWAADGTNELHALMRAGGFATLSNAVKEVTQRTPISLAQFLSDHAAVFRSAR